MITINGQPRNTEALITDPLNTGPRERSAAIHARHLADLPRNDLEQAIAWLLLNSSFSTDLDAVALHARLHSLEG